MISDYLSNTTIINKFNIDPLSLLPHIQFTVVCPVSVLSVIDRTSLMTKDEGDK
jgi:hypothetical protein